VIGDLGYLSTQVLGEFFVVATTRLRTPLPVAEACGRLQDLALAWRVLPITPLVALRFLMFANRRQDDSPCGADRTGGFERPGSTPAAQPDRTASTGPESLTRGASPA